MIVALWNRWRLSRQWWWLVVLCGFLVADVLVGSWLLSKELQLLKEAWQ